MANEKNLNEEIENLEDSEVLDEAVNEESKDLDEEVSEEEVFEGEVDEVAKLEATILELTEKNLKSLAEFQNYKKRAIEDYSNAKKSGIVEAVEQLIEVLDYMTMAIAHVDFDSADVDNTARGVQMVINIFEQKLENLGVKEINCSGIADHNYHQAIEVEKHEDLENDEIIKVLKKGYILDQTVIRFAQVVVNNK